MTKLALTAAAAFLCTLAPALAGWIYPVDNWPGDVDNIPCSAWRETATEPGCSTARSSARRK